MSRILNKALKKPSRIGDGVKKWRDSCWKEKMSFISFFSFKRNESTWGSICGE